MSSPPLPPPAPPDEWHVSEDQLEAFVMGHSLGEHFERVHTHLLGCDECCLRLVHEAEFIAALREELRKFRA